MVNGKKLALWGGLALGILIAAIGIGRWAFPSHNELATILNTQSKILERVDGSLVRLENGYKESTKTLALINSSLIRQNDTLQAVNANLSRVERNLGQVETSLSLINQNLSSMITRLLNILEQQRKL